MTEMGRPVARRAIISGFAAGLGALGMFRARNASAKSARWRPALEKDDNWLDIPSRHRLVFDATSANGAGHALFFARNYIKANESAYGISRSKLATIIILRHFATVFGYDDIMWEKYGQTFAELASFSNPNSEHAPARNLYDTKTFGQELPNANNTLSELARRGVHFAVCGAATQKIAGMIATTHRDSVTEIRGELGSHLIASGRIVAAGIVTVNRAQERGYALAYTG